MDKFKIRYLHELFLGGGVLFAAPHLPSAGMILSKQLGAHPLPLCRTCVPGAMHRCHSGLRGHASRVGSVVGHMVPEPEGTTLVSEAVACS